MRWLSILTLIRLATANQAHDTLAERVPDPLTVANFDETLENGYHVVEFFSPYCPHCTHLFPNWVEFYEQSIANNAPYKIHQVDCVNSGDLCDRENIRYYPMVRFYGPHSQLLASMTENSKDAVTLTKFADEQMMIWSDVQLDENVKVPANTLIDKDDLLASLRGSFDKPRLVSFWPTTDDQLNDDTFQNSFKENFVFRFMNIFQFRNVWNLALKSIVSKIGDEDKIDFHFFNCKSHEHVCRFFGFDELLDYNDVVPRVVLFLPNKVSNNAINYNHHTDTLPSMKSAINSLTQWTYRTLINYELHDMKFNDIRNFIDAQTKLPSRGEISDLLDYSKVAFVLINDPKTQVDEDAQILNYLIQDIADLNSNVFLFRTSDLQTVSRFLADQEHNLLDNYIHYQDEGTNDDAVNTKYSEHMFISRTRSSYPTLIAIKAGSIYTTVYKSFMSKDIRDAEKLLAFIKGNYLPVMTHLNDDTFDTLFPSHFDVTSNDKTEKVVLSITDFQPKQLFDVEFHNSFVYHKHIVNKNKHIFENIESKRAKKHAAVKKLRDKDASSDDIIMKLREEIDTDYTTPKNNIITAYTDLNTLKELVEKHGWSNVDIDMFHTGDVLVIDRFKNQYWRTTGDGDQLTIDKPNQTVTFLHDMILGKKLKNSIRLSNVSVLMRIIQIWTALIVTAIMYKLFRSWRLHRGVSHEKFRGLGILDLPNDGKFD
ncbi:hypothetical protein CANINC_000661 [Pichia inconspicua]|uniref:Thioredoxin domain-containing protein n=1 Tax=Pichia inconspicua TaxID=52247 RepID=A0A4T0X609_9ASCO|nr:hypothetical protein CANINC_000661 [[Candida] inconspicua]